jgi:hypothetical protein
MAKILPPFLFTSLLSQQAAYSGAISGYITADESMTALSVSCSLSIPPPQF